MTDQNNLLWMCAPAPKKVDVATMSLDQMIELLDQRATPDTATVFGEIKGLYAAYKLAPSHVLLEAIIAKCLTIILNADGKSSQGVVSLTPAGKSQKRPVSMEYEWIQGFEYFLLLNGISENTAMVYVRALKRVIKNQNIADVDELMDMIDWLIREYEGCDRASHNVHISALRQFKNYMNDQSGYLIAIEKDGIEEIVSRIYCSLDGAQEAYEGIISDDCDGVDKIRLYNKFAKLIKEYKVK